MHVCCFRKLELLTDVAKGFDFVPKGKENFCLKISLGKSSHRRRATTPASSSKVECKEIEASKESLHQELDKKKLDVANFLKVDLEEEDPEEEEDLEEEEDPKKKRTLRNFPLKFKWFSLEYWIHDLEKIFTLMDCTESQKDEMEAEFLRLTQGNLSLVEHERKFDELSCYAPHLVNIEECKARRFKKRLRPELYNAITVL
ncbi:hypothetical protein FNV43_RR04383 [Rhamnella rubrinervis]|uniref:Retrotransposon gag domain-containing protein n=1 Tax=Rhamnella rubrinervis TaxID=2594499 RepID=A0A8K0HJN0_9ROSA|nr:hypothetical protein FNV43_RR04383 [Rhamnella rubrinervis]